MSPVVFSDIDGTIMHEPSDLQAARAPGLLVTPPSTSGRQGVISERTIRQVAALRDGGIGLRFAIVTGARLSTLLMRLPYLPAADAYVCENGGRIFYPGSPLPTACPLTEDLDWRAELAPVTGPAEQDAVEPTARSGPLWDWFRALHADGWALDASGYTTSFRIHAGKNGKSLEQLQEVIKAAPATLACTFNLGAGDFYPASSGKLGAARFLMARWGAAPEGCAFLCDDDNDMQLAALVGKAFLPSVTSGSVQAAVAARPEQFVVAQKKGTAATEEMLDAVAAHFGLAPLPA